MKKTITTMMAGVLLGLGAAASALEVSLEENKAERGNIGYVDLKKIFRLYPETHKAKQSYAEIIRQAEEQVNLRKAEIMAMRAELSKLKVEKELVEKTPIPAAAPTPPAEPAISTPTVQVSTPAVVEVSTDSRPQLGQLPGMGPMPADVAQDTAPVVSSDTAPVQGASPTDAPLVIDIPGVTESPIVVDPGAAAVSTPTAAVDPGAEALAAREKRMKELDDSIAAKQDEIAEKEKLFDSYQAQVEKDLIDIESRRAEILLGKIYDAVREVARENGVSVVVDKGQILFGQNSVDLTDRVVKKLKETSL
ncbi:MAG: OmpH family outer membrane protein [Elusimicrobiota bacterium]